MRLETLVSRILFLGGGAGVALMLAGLVDLELHAPASRAVGVFVSLSALRRALDAWPPDPVAVVTSGIVVLLLAPALGLGAALGGFLRERDRLYAIIAALLLAALLVGFTLRLGG
ncbi:MAG TPA: DUF1634 domain-containing protein [Methylomirabilota bacterium]|jgi:uncharacterized membrane protein|nr:DUF1634 domain-containing protein [Methylomirabilota bacterium]